MTEGPELVARLAAGDARAFDGVYEHYRPRVFGFLVRLTRDRSLAEDLTQETFLRLARAARRLPAELDLCAWLFKVARNLAVDHRRWALLDFDRLFELSLWPRPVDIDTPLDLAEASETQEALEQALGALSAEHREVILLVCVEGLTPARAAVILELDATILRKRLSRARQRLLEALSAPAELVTEGVGS